MSNKKYTQEEAIIANLVAILLTDLEQHKPKELHVLVKSLGVLLSSCGEAIKSGSIKEARRIRLETPTGEQLTSPLVGVSLALMGDTIMDWSAGLRAHQKKQLEIRKNDSKRHKR